MQMIAEALCCAEMKTRRPNASSSPDKWAFAPHTNGLDSPDGRLAAINAASLQNPLDVGRGTTELSGDHPETPVLNGVQSYDLVLVNQRRSHRFYSPFEGLHNDKVYINYNLRLCQDVTFVPWDTLRSSIGFCTIVQAVTHPSSIDVAAGVRPALAGWRLGGL